MPRVFYEEEYTVLPEMIRIQAEVSGYDARTSKLTIVCIGTDRSTGDALGPLVGDLLQDRFDEVYGTIDNPVHAQNIHQLTIPADRFVIAIDAALGKKTSVGYIEVVGGPVKPGSGVGKDEIIPIGNMHIGGIVNVSGSMDYLVLQSTRLSVVMQMARCIAAGVEEALCVKRKGLLRRVK